MDGLDGKKTSVSAARIDFNFGQGYTLRFTSGERGLNPSESMMIGVILATYNGAQFIRELLASIRAQTHSDFRLYVRDDGSTDETLEIVQNAGREDDRIRVVQDGRGNQRVVQNFARLIEHALADGCGTVFFSDQDDVWHTDKIEIGLRRMRDLEVRHGASTPLLVHSDLEVVDSRLNHVHPSFIRYSGIRNNIEQPLKTLLVQNFVTGCTMVANRSLLEAALPIPSETFMHDWWLALCAAALGHVDFIEQPTIKYRQHDDNQVGATGFTYWQAVMKRIRGQASEHWQLFIGELKQAAALRRRLETIDADDSAQTRMVKQFVEMFGPGSSRLSRIPRLTRLGVPDLPFIRKALWLRRAILCPQLAELAIAKSAESEVARVSPNDDSRIHDAA